MSELLIEVKLEESHAIMNFLSFAQNHIPHRKAAGP